MTDKIESDVKSLLDINSMLNYRKKITTYPEDMLFVNLYLSNKT